MKGDPRPGASRPPPTLLANKEARVPDPGSSWPYWASLLRLGIFGRGFGGGTQARLHFLPAAQNDFLFAAFTEEWGVAGGAALLLTFALFLYRIGAVGLRARDNYAWLIAWGGGILFAVQSFINIGSNLGLLPVTGLTFPFFSYGGSSLLTSALLVGIIQHIKIESR